MQPRKLADIMSAKCTLGCLLLDRLLRGGIACGSITELVGEASAGKTQACLQLLVTCQWPLDQGGLHGKAMYMYTEGDPSLKRLLTIMSASAHQASPDNVYWERGIVDGEDLYERLKSAEVIMRQQQTLPLRLLIIDSIAHLFRDVGDDCDGRAYVQRTGLLFRLSALLRRYADMYHLAVVVTNQVSDAFTEAEITSSKQAPASKHTAGLRLLSSGREVVPALGFAWANCVNTRLFLSRTELTIPNAFAQTAEQNRSVHTPVNLPVRYMQIVFSPSLPQDTCLYVVGQFGLHGIDRASIKMTAQQPSELLERPLQPLSGQADLSESKPPGQAVGKVPRISSAEPENSLHAANGLQITSTSSQKFTSQTGSKLATGVFAPL